MKTINVLNQETIDKIAAGEVVERPASVVKELVENSIDAGATAITVEIKEGGIEYIRITDNGIGIDKSQIPIAFLRHATSKISTASDIDYVRSLGFRGEALSSIAAVSKIELITKTAEALLGSRYVIEGAKELSLTDIGAPNGTTFIIRQLFYNTPARKKFLKSSSTEGSYVLDIVEHLALSHPEISFRFIVNGKEKLMTSGNNVLADTVFQVFGRQVASNILNIDYSDENIKIYGFIGKSIIARGNRAFENFFVNKRYIKSGSLSKAVEDGYFGFLMGHQYPFFLLNLEFLNSMVDVNVHPTKQEVRFENEQSICELLCSVVTERLTKREDILDATFENEKDSNETMQPLIIEVLNKGIRDSRGNSNNIDMETSVKNEADTISIETGNAKEIIQNSLPKAPEPFEAKRLDEIKKTIVQQIREDSPYEKKYDDVNVSAKQLSFLDIEAIKEHKIIGQIFNTYWIIEYDKKMYVIDQHAAHEKVLFEKTMKQLKNNEMTSQLISPPIIISLSSSDVEVLERYKAAFNKMGYDFEEFGGNEIALKGVPGNLLNIDMKELFCEILADFSTNKGTDTFDAIVEKVASMSCKAAVKGNNKLSTLEIQSLIDDLLKCDNPYHCPHGRPTMISFTEYELAKKFKRII